MDDWRDIDRERICFCVRLCVRITLTSPTPISPTVVVWLILTRQSDVGMERVSNWE